MILPVIRAAESSIPWDSDKMMGPRHALEVKNSGIMAKPHMPWGKPHDTVVKLGMPEGEVQRKQSGHLTLCVCILILCNEAMTFM